MVITISVVDHGTVASSLKVSTLQMYLRGPKFGKKNIIGKLDRTPEEGRKAIVDVDLNSLHIRRKVGYKFKSKVDSR